MRVIIRKAYVRKAYTRKDGTRVKRTRVKAKRMVRPELPSKRIKVLPKLKKGTLTSLGYSSSKGNAARHRSLSRAVKKYGALSVSKKLNAVATLTKRTSPINSKIFKSDRKWVADKYIKRKNPKTRARKH